MEMGRAPEPPAKTALLHASSSCSPKEKVGGGRQVKRKVVTRAGRGRAGHGRGGGGRLPRLHIARIGSPRLQKAGLPTAPGPDELGQVAARRSEGRYETEDAEEKT